MKREIIRVEPVAAYLERPDFPSAPQKPHTEPARKRALNGGSRRARSRCFTAALRRTPFLG